MRHINKIISDQELQRIYDHDFNGFDIGVPWAEMIDGGAFVMTDNYRKRLSNI